MRTGKLLILSIGLILFSSVGVCAGASPSVKGTVESRLAMAMQDYRNGDYHAAFSGWKALAESGNAEAQYNLGLMYRDGEGVAVDYDQAMVWYRKAAAQGEAVAQSNIGAMYYKGLGVGQDYKKALYWYRKAADQGSAIAQQNIGAMYYLGYGVSQDIVQAAKWLFVAKANGSEMASLYLRKIEPKMAASQKDKALELAKKWWAEHHKS